MKESNLDYGYVKKFLVKWIREKVQDAGAKGVVLGLSGGIDSSVTSVLCKEAFYDNVLGIIMPCYSKKDDARDALNIAEKFKINYKIKNLEAPYDALLNLYEDEIIKDELKQLARANIKPRLRMTTLYYYAAVNNYLVVGTDNWSELKVGYFTKYGDGGIDITPLGSLVKSEVRELARFLKIPENIITKAPSAGLWEGQTDESEMGVSYEELDKYILSGRADTEIEKRIEKLADKSKHKLKPVPFPARELMFK